ncbi:MAG TPA: amidohydrolase [Bacteroidetes bacterium]|nr:amidohydrolase [Bacteroidota bacterium]
MFETINGIVHRLEQLFLYQKRNSMKQQFLLLVLSCGLLLSQSTQHIEGIRQNTPSVHVLKNITIVQSPGKRIEKGTIVIRDGMIQSVGAVVIIPADAREWDCTGLTAYAGLIDLYSDYGQPKVKPQSGQTEQPRGANYWNGNVKANYSVAENFLPDKDAAEKYRAMGFTTVLSVPQNGIFKGSSALVNLGSNEPNTQILLSNVFQHSTIVRENFPNDDPDSHMGVIASMRQTLIDAKWYSDAQKIYAKNPNQPRPEENATLASLENVVTGKQSLVIETNDELKELRASNIAKEFSLKWIVRGNGFEYRRIEAIKDMNVSVILPVNFPDAPYVETPEDAYTAGYEDLRHWDFASENPARLKKAGINFALTANQLKDIAKFRTMVKTAIDCGLSQDDALASLTTIPAQLVGMEKQLGTIEAGKIANLVITDGSLFAEKTKIRESWIEGNRYEVNANQSVDLRGMWSYSLQYSNAVMDSGSLDISGEIDAQVINVLKGSKSAKAQSGILSQNQFTLSFDGDSLGMNGVVRFSGSINENVIAGLYELPDGRSGSWSAKRNKMFAEKPDTAKQTVPLCSSNELVFPDGAFGRKEIPKQQDVLVKNATLWTSGPQGNLEETDLLVSKGNISKIGKGLSAPSGVVVIDAKGKHVTSGLIDAHSHTAISEGVNEAGQAITAEVRIGDVINADDINIYRQLAGGLTVVNQLHGSANAIGGQNSVIKLRWGMLPEQMKFEGAIAGIKFALGENPKQSNWGEKYTTRYPQTRMGVEQIIRDGFTAAREYDKSMSNAKANANVIPPRRDLELETLAEILNKKRLIHSHCYRQDEIMMLLQVSDDFGFQIGTLQHILEGYKVADEIAKRGVGASAFSDWWAYKYEVIDAIPYAGKLMFDAGVLVSYNSDSNEMARRMNLEAAKAVKYGGVSEIDALKFVTLNPAKQLRIDNRVGSIEVGKDGDFVIWSGHPLSTYTICEQTWIDGRKYFDRNEDAEMRLDIQKKKAELVQKALKSKKKGSGPSPVMKRSSTYSCHEEEHITELEKEVNE